MAKKSRRIGEILYKKGLVDKTSLAKAVKTAMKTKRRTGDVLIEMGVVTEDDIAMALAKPKSCPPEPSNAILYV